MFKIPCRCGESEKSFKVNIGEFFINECCEKAGYDGKGRMDGEEPSSDEDEGSDEVPTPDVPPADMSQAVVMTNEQAQDLKEPPALDKMKYEALKLLCKERGIEVTKDDRSKQSLITKLQA